MSEVSVAERGAAIARAKNAMSHLARHEDTTLKQLGLARQQLNNCFNAYDPAYLRDAVEAIEQIVLEVYGTVPVDEQATRSAES